MAISVQDIALEVKITVQRLELTCSCAKKRRKHTMKCIKTTVAYLHCVANLCQRVKGYDLFEIIEKGIAFRCMREISDSSRSGPRNDGSEEDADKNSSTDTIEHEYNCQHPSEENAKPHCRGL